MKLLPLILLPMMGISACSERTPSDAFLIPRQQIERVTKDAKAGDLRAIKLLIAHYEAASGSDALAEEWRAKARALGDVQELHYYAAKLLVKSKAEVDLKRKGQLLEEARRTLERAMAGNVDASTKSLAVEIDESLANWKAVQSGAIGASTATARK